MNALDGGWASRPTEPPIDPAPAADEAAQSPAPAEDGAAAPATPRPPASGAAHDLASRQEVLSLLQQRQQAPLGLSGGAALLDQVLAGREAVAALRAVQGRIAEATAVVPLGVDQAAHDALRQSAGRAIDALNEGRITADEAQAAARMLDEMLGALVAIDQGSFTAEVCERTTRSSDAMAYVITTSTGDQVRVTARKTGSDLGQARVRIVNVTDGGERVPSTDQLMVRFDLEGSREGDALPVRMAIDVQFGQERPVEGQDRLNKRIHGVMLDADGQPVRTRSGRGVPDHHFHGGIPSALNEPEAFEGFVSAFLARVREGVVEPEKGS